jgi:hypothetical protein
VEVLRTTLGTLANFVPEDYALVASLVALAMAALWLSLVGSWCNGGVARLSFAVPVFNCSIPWSGHWFYRHCEHVTSLVHAALLHTK